jgi:hypothetical protein
LGYSTQSIVVVNVAVVGIEVGIVVEVVQPTCPANL